MDVLDPLETAMMTGEMLSSPLHFAAVLIMSPPTDAGPGYVDDVYRHTLAATDRVDRRLRRYPYRGVDTGGVWAWRDVDRIDIRQHYARRTLPAGSGREALWRLVSELHAERLDQSRPMWMSYLIDGLDDGRFAFYMRVHHSVMDGVAGFQMITDLLTNDPERRSIPAFYAQPRTEAGAQSPSAPGQLPDPFPLLRSLATATMSSAGLVRRVVSGGVSNLVHSLTTDTTVAPLEAPYTRFNGRVGDERAFAAGSWSRSRVRAVRLATRVAATDVLTAVVAGVLRSWLQDRGELPKQSLVAICPIAVRGPEHLTPDQTGNMFGGWLCPLGTDLDDPVARLDLIHRSMSEGKNQVAECGASASMMLLAVSIAPTLLFPRMPLAPKVRTGYNLPLSIIPGPPVEMYWNGAHVEEIYPVSVVYDGQALNVTMCSYSDRIGIGYVAGRDVMPDIESFIPLTERSLAELEAAVIAHP